MRGTVFGARWEFTCACCGERQAPDSLAVYRPDGLLVSAEPDHPAGDADYVFLDAPRDLSTKAPEVMPRGKKASDRCDVCFQVPAANGVCGCPE